MQNKVTNLLRDTETNSVLMIYWQSTVTKDGKTLTEEFNSGLQPKLSSDPSFIPYENITEEIANQWLQEVLSGAMFENLEEQLLEQLDNQAPPAHANGLPW